jgi:hypothetical protein
MINKIYKRIHNKYSTLFKFTFFLRHLFAIFFISLALFFLIPHFFDFKKKEDVIKDYLSSSYDLKLHKFENIKYNALPIPHLKIKNVTLSLEKESIKIKNGSLKIYPKLLNIYNFENFKTNKIVLKKNKMLLEDNNFKLLINYIYNLKNRFSFKNLDLKINKNDNTIINIEKIYFSNYGYNKNIARGELFNKKFKISTDDRYNKINFKLLKTGISGNINFDEIKKKSVLRGIFKSKLLNSNLKFNFNYDDKKLKIYNSYFRSRNLSFNNESKIIYKPFFSINSIFTVEDMNKKILEELNINKIISSKKIIKKINTKSEINYKSKKFSQNLIDDFNLNINLTYGRLSYLKKISISENFFICKGDINLLEEFPILFFDCSIMSKDKKNFLKIFSIKYKNKNELFKLKVKGNINVLNKKINFKNISMNQNYEASKEDLNYYKQSFENIIFDKNLLGILNLKKIKKFISETS